MNDNKNSFKNKTKEKKRKDNISLNQKSNKKRASRKIDITGQNKTGDSLQKNTDTSVKETQEGLAENNKAKKKLKRKNKKTPETLIEETEEKNSQENMTKEKMMQNNKPPKNYKWLGIILGVLGLTAAGIFLKRKNNFCKKKALAGVET